MSIQNFFKFCKKIMCALQKFVILNLKISAVTILDF